MNIVYQTVIALIPPCLSIFLLSTDKFSLEAVDREFEEIAKGMNQPQSIANLIKRSVIGYQAMSGVVPTLISLLTATLVLFGHSNFLWAAELVAGIYCLAIFWLVNAVIKGPLNFYELANNNFYFGKPRSSGELRVFWSDEPITHADAISVILLSQNVLSIVCILGAGVVDWLLSTAIS